MHVHTPSDVPVARICINTGDSRYGMRQGRVKCGVERCAGIALLNPPCRTSGVLTFSVALAYLDKALVVFGIHLRKVAAAVGSGHADVRYFVMSIGPATFIGLVTALQALKMVLEICA